MVTFREVDSGVWQWSVAYQEPDVRRPYTTDDLIRDITCNHAARDILMDVLQQVGAPEFLMGMLLNERSTPLNEALSTLSNHEEAAELISAAFADL